MNDTLALILGGGAGTRLYPLTRHRSKPAVPLAGKYRLIDVPISNCLNSDVNRIFVLTQFNSASLNRHISRAYRFDRFGSGFVTLLAAEQTPNSKNWFQGTADAVRQSMHHLLSYRYDHVLILSGDQLYAMDYRQMVEHHKSHGADITIATIPVHENDAPGFGILKTDDHHHITEFYEKPPKEELAGKESPVSDQMRQHGRVYLASMGIYVFSKGVLRRLLEGAPDAHDFGKEIIPSSIDSHTVVSYPFDGFWSDIGTIRSFYEANLMLARPYPEFGLYEPNRPLYTNARMLPPAKILNSQIENSLIAEASVISHSHIIDSVIGLRSYIGDNTVIKSSVLMGADYFPWHAPEQRDPYEGPLDVGVKEGCHIENTIVDRNVRIGKHCRITNKDGIQEGEGDQFYIREGLVVIVKNAEIPDNTVI